MLCVSTGVDDFFFLRDWLDWLDWPGPFLSPCSSPLLCTEAAHSSYLALPVASCCFCLKCLNCLNCCLIGFCSFVPLSLLLPPLLLFFLSDARQGDDLLGQARAVRPELRVRDDANDDGGHPLFGGVQHRLHDHSVVLLGQ